MYDVTSYIIVIIILSTRGDHLLPPQTSPPLPETLKRPSAVVETCFARWLRKPSPYLLFDCDSKGRYPRAERTLIPAETCRPDGPAAELLVPESRPAGDLHLRPRPHTEPVNETDSCTTVEFKSNHRRVSPAKPDRMAFACDYLIALLQYDIIMLIITTN